MITDKQDPAAGAEPEADTVRTPAVAGQFYPKEKEQLKADISYYLSLASDVVLPAGFRPRIIIAPHAGYGYCGEALAAAYRPLIGRKVRTVVLAGNSHSDYFSGIAIDGADGWQTPLGLLEIDQRLAASLAASSPRIFINSEVHVSDHILETQLPFLQSALSGGFKIVPAAFGGAESGDSGELAKALSEHLREDDLLVVSSDLSHYPSADAAAAIDRRTLALIQSLDIAGLEAHIRKTMEQRVPGEQTLCCGLDAVKAAMALAKAKGWTQGAVLKQMNSGDLPGAGKARVVGYGALAFGPASDPASGGSAALDGAQKKRLLAIARQAVEDCVGGLAPAASAPADERLLAEEGAFVTLRSGGRLRGCIGQITPSGRPLWETVRDMAVAAATGDPRFPPVAEDELGRLEYEISVLSAPRAIDDWRGIVPGKHGVIIRQGGQSGVFLPQVADETGWSREELLEHLCADKAGLPRGCYRDPDAEILVFTAQVF